MMDEERRKILIADDERANLQVLGTMLKEAYEVSVATRGEEVEALVRATRFDLILLDIVMPGMSGLEVCARLKADPDARDIPIIFITARSDAKAIEECFSAGGADYIPKPMNAPEVQARVRTQLELARERGRLSLAYRKLNEKHEELKKTQNTLVQSEKMASVGILVAGVAHEINNPTNFVHGGARNLISLTDDLKDFIFQLAGENLTPEIKDKLNEKFRPLHENLRAISDGTERIATIVHGLRAFSRMDEGDSEQASVVEGLQATLNLVRAKFKGQVDFVTDFQADPVITCWPAQLNQVFMNLAINACQAIASAQGAESAQGKLEVSTFSQDGRLAIRFRDNGPGIPEGIKSLVFDPFFTTKPVGEGTGLGLSISFGIIEKHQGTIVVDSAAEEGTAFTILLPL